jgi:hAT family C-terminal dimerisation region
MLSHVSLFFSFFFQFSDDSDITITNHEPPDAASSPPSKRFKSSINDDPEFSSIFDIFNQPAEPNQDESKTASIQQEALQWLERKSLDGLEEAGITTAQQLQDPSTILLFWKEAAHKFPLLACWARFVFSIPATSATVERQWHRCKLNVTPLRHAISASLVSDELFIAVNQDQV